MKERMLNSTLQQQIYDKSHEILHIVTHDHCPDGLAAAMILQLGLPDADVRFLQHGTDAYEDLDAEEGMIFCDISPPAARVQEFIDVGAIVLDHHVTAKAVVERFGDRGVYREGPGISGATLAYSAFYSPIFRGSGPSHNPFKFDEVASRLAHLAGIRDTWQTSDPHWREACEQASLLLFFPSRWWIDEGGMDHLFWQDMEEPFDLFEVGKVAFQNHLDKVKKACDEAYRFTTARGTRVVVIASTTLTSDAAELLGDEADLVIGFRYTVENGKTKFIVSTRSHASFDCAGFCKSNGGGGHRAAAGCAALPIGSPYQQIHMMIQDWEGPHL